VHHSPTSHLGVARFWCSADGCRVSGEQLAALAAAMLQDCQRRNSTVEQLSYNVVLTRKYLQIMPRSAEASGDVSVNALGGAGTFFVKRQEQLTYIEQRTPGRVLSDVGFQW
jgi:sulfate adenylyltransferase (ADP) / ATP adenylyltransferase